MKQSIKHSLRFKITAIFVSLVTLTLLGSWFINNFFLEKFYIQKKMGTLIDTYYQLEELVSMDITDKDNWEEVRERQNRLKQVRDAHNLAFLCTDTSYQPVVSVASDKELLSKKLIGYMYGGNQNRTLIATPMENVRIELYYDETLRSAYMDCWGYIGDNYLFIVSVPIESIRESVQISNQFLIYVGIIIASVSAILVYFITRKITKPILELSQISKKVANLDFSAKYVGKEEDEIGVLGNSMNELANQLDQTIEELKNANIQLKKDIEEKVQIDELRKEFLSNVSHELKTPIALIQGYAEGLKEGINDDEESRNFYCDVIMDEADKMNKMVRKLLTLNHIEFGQEEMIMEQFDIVELVQSVVNASSIMIQQKNAHVTISGMKEAIVIGDEFKIEEVVTNYISNALNHLQSPNNITIHIYEKGDKVRVSVHNTGKPIPDEDLEKVWIKFYKVDKARTRAYGGSGIGLSIVKAIMDAMNEQCGVENKQGGVEFWFELKKGEIISESEETLKIIK